MLQRQSLFTNRDDRLRRGERSSAPAAAFTPPSAESARQSETARSEAKESTSQTPTATKGDESSKSRLIVGPEITLKSAEITDCDTIVVEGRIEATTDARVMQIAESGTFVGTVGVDIAEVRGRFEGDLTVRKTRRSLRHARCAQPLVTGESSTPSLAVDLRAQASQSRRSSTLAATAWVRF